MPPARRAGASRRQQRSGRRRPQQQVFQTGTGPKQPLTMNRLARGVTYSLDFLGELAGDPQVQRATVLSVLQYAVKRGIMRRRGEQYTVIELPTPSEQSEEEVAPNPLSPTSSAEVVTTSTEALSSGPEAVQVPDDRTRRRRRHRHHHQQQQQQQQRRRYHQSQRRSHAQVVGDDSDADEHGDDRPDAGEESANGNPSTSLREVESYQMMEGSSTTFSTGVGDGGATETVADDVDIIKAPMVKPPGELKSTRSKDGSSIRRKSQSRTRSKAGRATSSSRRSTGPTTADGRVTKASTPQRLRSRAPPGE